MLVIPMKWVPYLLVFVGLICLVRPNSGEELIGGIVLLVLGGIWLYLRYSSNSKSSTEKTEESKSSTEE